MKPNNILYGFYYNSMTEESSYALISLHRSKDNAEKAMKEHKDKAFAEWTETKERHLKEYGNFWPYSEFGTFEAWAVWEVEVLP